MHIYNKYCIHDSEINAIKLQHVASVCVKDYRGQ